MNNEIDPASISQDAEVVQALVRDPLVHNRVSAGLGMAMLNAGEWALMNAEKFSLPLLLMHGTADKITSAEASRAFAERAGKACTLKLWEGLYHELHNEPQKQDVFDYVVIWLSRQSHC